MPEAQTQSGARLIAKVLYAVVHEERPATMADAADLLKFRLARYRIRATVDEIGEAFRLVRAKWTRGS